jgi:hypothetical protein
MVETRNARAAPQPQQANLTAVNAGQQTQS